MQIIKRFSFLKYCMVSWFCCSYLAATTNNILNDPFADIVLPDVKKSKSMPSDESTIIKYEIYGMTVVAKEKNTERDNLFARFSIGNEVQKRFSSDTKTIATADLQLRLVYREGLLDSISDYMAFSADHLEFEIHNAYIDFFNVIDSAGQANIRVGHFYQPFGLNQQTDTHGTILQLSNSRIFGNERDWQIAVYGALNNNLDYQFAWLAGTDHENRFKGQNGIGTARFSLSSKWLFEYGFEGGISFASGEMINMPNMYDTYIAKHENEITKITVGGIDLRKRINTGMGLWALTTEVAVGEKKNDTIGSILGQIDGLNSKRTWGSLAQIFYYKENMVSDGSEEDMRAIFLITHYFHNDPANASLHWIAAGIETKITGDDNDNTFGLLQYYRYW